MSVQTETAPEVQAEQAIRERETKFPEGVPAKGVQD